MLRPRLSLWRDGLPGPARGLALLLGLLLGLLSSLLLSACASAPQSGPPSTAASAPQQQWSGRLALQLQSQPPRAFSAGFELRGAPEQGTLALYGPLGTSLASLVWLPGQATLKIPGQPEQQFESTAALTAALLGAELPIAALFDWLQGRAHELPGWQVDLSALADKRLSAQRLAPEPRAQLRLALE